MQEMEAGQTGTSTSFNFSLDVVEVLSKREKTTRESLLGRMGFFFFQLSNIRSHGWL